MNNFGSNIVTRERLGFIAQIVETTFFLVWFCKLRITNCITLVTSLPWSVIITMSSNRSRHHPTGQRCHRKGRVCRSSRRVRQCHCRHPGATLRWRGTSVLHNPLISCFLSEKWQWKWGTRADCVHTDSLPTPGSSNDQSYSRRQAQRRRCPWSLFFCHSCTSRQNVSSDV